MTEQEKRAEFCRRTGRVATSATVEYQAFLWGVEAGSAAEREACAKRLNDRAEQFRTKTFPHMYEEKAQILDYAAELVRSNVPHEGRTAALSPGVPLDAVVGPWEER